MAVFRQPRYGIIPLKNGDFERRFDKIFINKNRNSILPPPFFKAGLFHSRLKIIEADKENR